MIDALIAALDLQQPDWYVRLADHQDLQEYATNTAVRKHFQSASPERAISRLKRFTAERLFVVLRAAVQSGLVADKESLQSALGSAEENCWDLIDIARNAHSAELQAAVITKLVNGRIGGELDDADTLTKIDEIINGAKK